MFTGKHVSQQELSCSTSYQPLAMTPARHGMAPPQVSRITTPCACVCGVQFKISTATLVPYLKPFPQSSRLCRPAARTCQVWTQTSVARGHGQNPYMLEARHDHRAQRTE